MSSESNEFIHFFLDEANDALDVWEKACLELERSNSTEAKEELYRAAHNLKSGSGAVGLSEFNKLVHQVEDLIAKVLAGQLQQTPDIIKILLNTHSILMLWVDSLKNSREFLQQPAVQKIEQSLRSLLQAESEAQEPVQELVTEPVLAATPDARLQNSTLKSQESIRVAAPKLDQLIQLVGELSTQQAIVWHGRQNNVLQSKSCDNAIQLIQKIAKDLQNLALSLRMQPLQSLFQRLERSARDVARSQEKKIEVVISGEHVEVDRTVIERISDALNHVIRNAVDHGVETPAERQNHGKSAFATIHIEAVQETNGVAIIVRDDGRGLNTAKIRSKAVEQKLIAPDAELGTADIHRLIFHAGLSTAEHLTDISGRGVGMDVVKNSVEVIGGSIYVSSIEQEGTRFAISLPATLSIIDALIIVVDGNRYAIPVQDVSEIIDAQSSHIESVAGLGRLLSLRDQIIPVEPLQDHLPASRVLRPSKTQPDPGDSSGNIFPTLIVRGPSEALAFDVHMILGQQPVTVRRLPHLIAGISGYTGGTILGDGDPCVILNLPALMSKHFDRVHRSRTRLTLPPDAAYSDFDKTEKHRIDAIENRILIFEIMGHEFGAPLLSINEIVRGLCCESMPGSHPYISGSIQLRGVVLPVYHLGLILGVSSLHDEAASTFVILKDGENSYAIMVNRVCAVSALQVIEDSIKSKQKEILPHMQGYIGTALFENRTVTLIDLQQTIRCWEQQQPESFNKSTIVHNLEVS